VDGRRAAPAAGGARVVRPAARDHRRRLGVRAELPERDAWQLSDGHLDRLARLRLPRLLAALLLVVAALAVDQADAVGLVPRDRAGGRERGGEAGGRPVARGGRQREDRAGADQDAPHRTHRTLSVRLAAPALTVTLTRRGARTLTVK